jgi:uncharacterized protein (DUF169 family)
MAVMNEDFDRCTECLHAYFTPVEVTLIAKGSDYNAPSVIKTITQYKCAACKHLQYVREA